MKKNIQHIPRSTTLLIAVCMSITILLIFAQVFISNRFVTSGMTVVELEKERAQYVEQNERLMQKIASASSLLTIEQKAITMGFQKGTKFVSISSDLPVALDR